MLLNPMCLGMRGDTSSGPRGKSLGSLGFFDGLLTLGGVDEDWAVLYFLPGAAHEVAEVFGWFS